MEYTRPADSVGRVRILAGPNAFFGGNVSVTGLLVGRDIATAIRSDDRTGTYVVPDVVFNDDGLTLDDMTLADIAREAGRPVHAVAPNATGLLRACAV